jgi:hypothetical protein
VKRVKPIVACQKLNAWELNGASALTKRVLDIRFHTEYSNKEEER